MKIRLPQSILFIAVVAVLWPTLTAMKVRYACPSQNYCVPYLMCPGENQVHPNANGQPEDITDIMYMCGKTISSEAHVCCGTVEHLPEAFEPTVEKWYYDTESDVDETEFTVVPWPGYGTRPLSQDSAVEPDVDSVQDPAPASPRLCPENSYCVPALLCPHPFITYSMVEISLFGIGDARYDCGVIGETATFACCKAHVVVTALFDFVRKYENEHKDRFVATGGEQSYLRISVKDEEDTKESLDNLFRFKLSSYTETSKKSQDSSMTEEADDESVLDENHSRRRRDADTTIQLPEASNLNSARGGISSRTAGVQIEKCGTSLGMSQYARLGAHVNEAIEGQYPWHVAVLSSNYHYMCGGILIGGRWVLTVAHCVDTNYGHSLLVRVGDHDLLQPTKTKLHQAYDIRVKKVNIHPHYMKTNLRADLAVLELQTSVLNLYNVNRVCLPGELQYANILDCEVAGWAGMLPTKDGSKGTSEFSSVLLRSKYQTVTREDCQHHLRSVSGLGRFFRLQDGVLCAKSSDYSSKCLGDGGSGLVCKTSSGQYILRGLVSWGVGCRPQLPTAFVDISYYLPFINSIISGRSAVGPTKNTHGFPHERYDAPHAGYDAPRTGYETPPKGYDAPYTRYDAPHTGYDAPLKGYDAPHTGYDAPHTGYDAPHTGYDAPHTGYDAPHTGYDAPHTGYDAPHTGYDAPHTGYDAPHTGYDAPHTGYDAPLKGYDAPHTGYDAPHTGYDAPHTGYDAPHTGYDAPHTGYDAPLKGYDAPHTGYDAPLKGYDAPHTGYVLPKGYDAPHTGYDAPPKGYDTPYTGYDAPPKGYDTPYTGYDAPPKGYDTPYTGYDAPPKGYDTPYTGYDAPPKGYDTPYTGYDAPPKGYDTPYTGYNAPPKGYDAPHTRYDAPPKGYDAPHTRYDARQGCEPSHTGYDAPPKGYDAPHTGYDAPPKGYVAPPKGYDAPHTGYDAPPKGYDTPHTGYDAPPRVI
ncbi:uncharacterized protein LOC122243566 isoform X4 [Penaeus japonicus]|uniref:uncharacterized protein LOC122243566 isoform X4 n=1 Tax=Penaeus japonicus TaxID=27405 RepID=UPI001C710D23|nr:uncharacterized protein LOC122243566 isoform X4 [Penaeus japonicus]